MFSGSFFMHTAKYCLFYLLIFPVWVQGATDSLVWDEQATRFFSSKALGLRWTHELGDWVDKSALQQGPDAFAAVKITDEDRQQYIYWDVTQLAKRWADSPIANQGLMLKSLPSNKGITSFLSRESDSVLIPLMIIKLASGKELNVEATADTYISRGTRQAQGDKKFIRVGSSEHGLLYFPLPASLASNKIIKAELFLTTTVKQYGDNKVGVYQPYVPIQSPVEQGIATAYTVDQGLDRHSSVVFADRFDNDQPLSKHWVDLKDPHSATPTSLMDEAGFSPLDGKALPVLFSPRTHTAISMALKLKTLMQQEPEEIYFRYYLRLGTDWNSDRGGGKFPGFGGTYGRAGWGGRKPDGKNGWSARGMFLNSVVDGPHRGEMPIGSYVYHVDHKNNYGEQMPWSSFDSLLEKNRWYSIEQYLRLNTPGQNDGVLKAWVDGRKVTEIDNLRFRDTDALKIEKIWFDFYHGGGAKPSKEQHLFIDNVVVATEYIGPAGVPARSATKGE
ncbi:MAG: hypothetical protein ACJAWL_001735 [Motiliproteus sp.]